ncbi:diguanylate cyclase [Muricoccus pecuniae]|uniref:diguanylate cyclase n=1 Tax=Muricoccus pecuniae TaxID=693023 RepID=A0A840XZ47_9PROT|nr:diguanylate cyclase [Roseomonas pecuniae]MBB5693166.1 diguanylate cyclase (GGDEF)-like protein/PAS domain S-box-containing protein [Roseomonas pecuniae]
MPHPTGAAPSRPASRRFRLAFPAILSLSLLLVVAEAWNEWSGRERQIEETGIAASNLARSLVQEAESDFAMADAALLGIVEQVEAEGTAAGTLAPLLRLMRRQLDIQPKLRNFSIYGPDGTLALSSFPSFATGASIADRDYFARHREEAGEGMLVGTAVRSRLDGEWIVTLSRRIGDGAGRFGGVAVAAMEIEALSRGFARFDLGRHGSVALLRSDGRLLARNPVDEAALDAPMFRRLPGDPLSEGRPGRFHYASPIDGIERLGAYETGERYPIGVIVGRGAVEALAAWTVRAALRAGVVLLLAGLLVLMGHRLVRQIRRRREAEGGLAASEAHFRLLAEHASDMVSRLGPDGLIRYASPAAARLIGLPPRGLIGRPMEALVLPEDRPALHEALAVAGEPGRQGEVTCRVSRPDGSVVWLETTLRRLEPSPSGEVHGYVAVSRDVTERRSMESRLAELASTDGLTGLANRRRFDEVLNREWRRAAREESCLAVLLLDVDHFKAFNDLYGHLSGDDALREVARAIGETIRRPGDLAARYGGEEFAAVLPRTDAAGAREVAERIRGAIAALGIGHEGNAAGHITASIGVAAVQPHAFSAPDAPMLLGAADSALYEAKRSGRDRVFQAPPITVIQARRVAAR